MIRLQKEDVFCYDCKYYDGNQPTGGAWGKCKTKPKMIDIKKTPFKPAYQTPQHIECRVRNRRNNCDYYEELD